MYLLYVRHEGLFQNVAKLENVSFIQRNYALMVTSYLTLSTFLEANTGNSQ